MFDIGNGPAGRADGVIVGGEAQQAVSTTPANAADSPDIQQTRWRIDPQRSASSSASASGAATRFATRPPGATAARLPP